MANVNTTTLLKQGLLYVLVTFLFFLVGLYAFFPGEAVRQRLQQTLTAQLGQPVDVGTTTLGFPLTVKIESARIPLDPALTVTAETLRIRPVWSSLFTGAPAVTITGRVWDGTVAATINSDNRLLLEAHHLQWRGTLPGFPALSAAVQLGDLTLTGTTTAALPLEALTLSLSSLTLEGMQAIGGGSDRFSLGQLFLQARQDNGRLHIEQLQSRDGDLVVNADGHITPGRRPDLSRLDLTVTLIPQPSTDPALTGLLQLVSAADQNGHFILRLQGTPAQPVLR